MGCVRDTDAKQKSAATLEVLGISVNRSEGMERSLISVLRGYVLQMSEAERALGAS